MRDSQTRLHQMTDRQLLQAYAHGSDCQAFGAFVDRHQSALLSFASAFLRDDSLAQDVVQEAFLRAARNPDRLLGQNSAALSSGAAGGVSRGSAERPSGTAALAGPERNWLLKVVRDLSVDSLRRRASERRAIAGQAQIREHAAPDPGGALERSEELDRMRAAIDRLRPRYRELLLLKVREQKSYKEIAEITGLSVTNVGFLLHQAMKALTQQMQGGADESAAEDSENE